MKRLRRTLGGLAAAGTLINGVLEWGADGRLQKVKLGSLAVWDRRRWAVRVERWRRRRRATRS